MKFRNENDIRDAIEETRRRFDHSFSLPHPPLDNDVEDFLAIRVGGHPYALRATELVRVEPIGRTSVLPGSNSWLVGLAAVRGKLIPVYSLDLILSYQRPAADYKWIAIGREELLGFAFDSVDGYLRTQRVRIVNASTANQDRAHCRQAFDHDGKLRLIANLPSILTAIREKTSAPASVEAH